MRAFFLMSNIKLFVGLGNPGEKYETTRHNAGYWWIDFIERNHRLGMKPFSKFNGIVGKYSDQVDCFFLKPTTFMNESGRSVQSIVKFYKIKPEEMLVIHDELDLQPGTIKLKFGGGHGGHNGLKSIESAIGSNNFWRLRIGIGHPGIKDEVAGYVLKKPLKKDFDLINASILDSYRVFSNLLLGEFEKAMLNLHSTLK